MYPWRQCFTPPPALGRKPFVHSGSHTSLQVSSSTGKENPHKTASDAEGCRVDTSKNVKVFRMQLSHSRVDIEHILKTASLAEKISLLAGSNFWNSTPLPQYNVPAIKCTDGPNGVRGSKFFDSTPALCIPCGSGLGATWNIDLVEQAGELLSKECAAKGAHVWLGPTVNIPRSPLNGRGFESFSEDPVLSGMLAGAIIRGVQSGGIAATLKHFVCNDQETEKMTLSVCLSERALREIYLLPFQIAMKESKPRIMMASYNKVQGSYTSESPKLLQKILRQEWGFDGLIMSDWFGTYSCKESIAGGLDLEMPGPARFRGVETTLQMLAASPDQERLLRDIDRSARKILELVNDAASAKVEMHETTRDVPEDRILNRCLAAESIVLLKNSQKMLPIAAEDCNEIAIIGPNAKLPAACGGGSANLRPYYTTSIYDGIRNFLPPDTQLQYEPGVYGHVLLPILSGADVCNDDGVPGVSIQFFNEPHTNTARERFDYISIPETSYQLMDYHHEKAKDPFFMSMRAYYEPTKTGLYEFGLAVYGTAVLYINDELVVDLSTHQERGGMFFGKGSCERRGTFQMTAGQRYCLRVEAGSASTSKVLDNNKLPLPGGACRLGGCLIVEKEEGIRSAVELAKRCKYTFVVVGLNSDYEKEGMDRVNMNLPAGVDDLITAVLAEQPNAIIITQAGNPVAMPWRSQANTIIHTWYGGNEAGNAMADIIFGRVNPSGKLPMTFPAKLEDNPSYLSFGKSQNSELYYMEDIFVGYRWYDARKIEVAFPFGHGLSFTTFSMSTFQASTHGVRVWIKNTGPLPGAEVLAMYVSRAKSSPSRFIRAPRSLVAFQKVFLDLGEELEVTMPITKYSTAIWDSENESWCCEKGTYVVTMVAGQQTLEAMIELEKDLFWNGV